MYKYDSCKCQAKKTFNMAILNYYTVLLQTKNNEHNEVKYTDCRKRIFPGSSINVNLNISRLATHETYVINQHNNYKNITIGKR